MYSVPGFGIASGGLMIIVEIILTKLKMFVAPFGTILLLLTLSSTLVAVNIWMIDTMILIWMQSPSNSSVLNMEQNKKNKYSIM